MFTICNGQLYVSTRQAAECQDETLVLGVTVRVFPDEISIGIIGVNKVVCPPRYEWASSDTVKT